MHPLKSTTPTLSSGTINVAYTPASFTVSGGWSPYTVAVNGLPAGLVVTNTNNVYTISGTPTVSGTFPISVSISDDKSNRFDITTLSIKVAAAPVASCSTPAGGKSTQMAQSNITAATASTITVSGKVINVLPCTAITWSGNWSTVTKAFRVGYKAELKKGYTFNGSIYATTLNIDNGL